MICWVILGNISFLFSDFHFPSQDIGDLLWASVSNNVLISIAFQLKNCSFTVKGKVCFFRAPLQLCQLCTYLFHMEGIKICIIPNEGTIQGWICHCRRRSIVRGLSLFLPPPLQVESPYVSIRAIMPCFSCVTGTSFFAARAFMQISLNTMQSRIQPHLFFAGEVILLWMPSAFRVGMDFKFYDTGWNAC